MIQFSEEQIQGIVAAASEKIQGNIVSTMKDAIESRVRYALDDQISSTVGLFFNAELKPQLLVELSNNRDIMAKEIVSAALAIGQIVASKLVERATKNMASEYDCGKIFDAMFKR